MKVGDSVSVDGQVEEFIGPGYADRFDTDLSITEIKAKSVIVKESNQPLPKAVVLGENGVKIPDTIIDNDDDSLRKFQHEFCGLNAEANSNTYVTEYVLPLQCEMPLGIAFDGDAKKVWYVSTKNGMLGSYNIKENRFDQGRLSGT